MSSDDVSGSMDGLMTHSGVFHADDVFAAATLSILYPDAPIVRTREQERLEQATSSASWVCFDVGDHFDPSMQNFDHHQRSFGRRRDNGVPYAAFGLVWETHGEAVVRAILSEVLSREPDQAGLSGFVRELCELVDVRLVQAVDAADCGELSERAHLKDHEEVALSTCNVSRVVAMYNPPRGERLAHRYDEAFARAMEMARALLEAQVQRVYEFVGAAHVVAQADDGTPLLVLDSYVPWQQHIRPHHLFVLSPALDGSGWMIETVQEDFVSRHPLPQAWAGLRDSELATASGVADAIFCHRARFIAAARSKQGALDLIKRALDEQVSQEV